MQATEFSPQGSLAWQCLLHIALPAVEGRDKEMSTGKVPQFF